MTKNRRIKVASSIVFMLVAFICGCNHAEPGAGMPPKAAMKKVAH